MAEEEGLTEAFEAWSQSRDAFQKWVEAEKPSAPADKWQKLYYRGIRPDGAPGAADHDSKLRLKPFLQPDGKPMTPAEAVKRPIKAPPKAEVSQAALSIALGRIGFKPD